MFDRNLKTRFSLLKPPLVTEQILNSQEKSIKNHKGKRNTHFEIGKKVIIRDYTNPNKPGWVPAVVQEKMGERHYNCVIEHNGRLIKRHLDQIRGSNESFSTNQNDQQIFNEQTGTEADTSQEHDASGTNITLNESQLSAGDATGNLNDESVIVVDSSIGSDSASDSNNDTFGDAMSTPPPVRASALNALDRLKDQRKRNLI